MTILSLRSRYGNENVVASDVRKPVPGELGTGPFVYADVLKPDHLERAIVEHGITSVVHFSALLSAVGERNPSLALELNMRGFQNVLELGTLGELSKASITDRSLTCVRPSPFRCFLSPAKTHNLAVFCPSTIGAFGPTTPRVNTPDLTIMRPSTIYGITKVHVELLGEVLRKCDAVSRAAARS